MLSYLMAQVLNIVLAVAVPTVSYLGIRYLQQRWNLKLSQDEFNMLTSFAKNAVMSSEQQFKEEQKSDLVNKNKRDAAIENIIKNAERRGIKISKDLASELVEAAVHEVIKGKPVKGQNV